LTLLALALLPILSLAPAQSAERGTYVVLVRASGGDLPDGWNEAIQGAATSAASELKEGEVLPPPQVGVTELELAVGCEEWNPACAGRIALMLNAESALVVEVIDRGRGAWLETFVVTPDGTMRRERQRYELPDRGEAGLELTRDAVRAAILGETPTTLVVETDVPGATVFLDGTRVGVTPWVGRKLTPGRHEVRLELDGRAPIKRTLDVRAGQTERIAVVMSAGNPPVRTAAVNGGGGEGDVEISPPMAWTMVGVGSTVAVLGVVVIGGGLFNAWLHDGQARAGGKGLFLSIGELDRLGSPFADGSPPHGVNEDLLVGTTVTAMVGGISALVIGGTLGAVGGWVLANDSE